jgi:hypothetical protein
MIAMNLVLDPTLQMIHCSSAGRSGVLAHLLAPDLELALRVAKWVDRLVRTASGVGIALNTRNVRGLFATPIEDLEDVCKKSHPSQMRGFGAMDSTAAQVLEHWCGHAAGYLAALVHVALDPSSPADICLLQDPTFPEAVGLSRYQRNGLGAYLQVANDALATLTGLLQLASTPYSPLFTSSFTAEELTTCQAACEGLAAVFAWGYRWLGEQPIDRRRAIAREYLDDAQTALMLLFEGTPDHQRRPGVAQILIELADLKRRV